MGMFKRRKPKERDIPHDLEVIDPDSILQLIDGNALAPVDIYTRFVNHNELVGCDKECRFRFTGYKKPRRRKYIAISR